MRVLNRVVHFGHIGRKRPKKAEISGKHWIFRLLFCLGSRRFFRAPKRGDHAKCPLWLHPLQTAMKGPSLLAVLAVRLFGCTPLWTFGNGGATCNRSCTPSAAGLKHGCKVPGLPVRIGLQPIRRTRIHPGQQKNPGRRRGFRLMLGGPTGFYEAAAAGTSEKRCCQTALKCLEISVSNPPSRLA